MPLVPRENAAPSHLGVVLRAIVEAIGQAGDATPVMVGEHYVKNPINIGAPPHIILVPEPNGGRCKVEKPYETGRAAKQVHMCDVIVRASQSGDEITPHDAAYDLNDRVISVVGRMCAGRWMPTEAIGDYTTPFTTETGAGVQLSWGFTYDRDIRADEAVARVAPSAPDDTAARPFSPPGETGTLDGITGTTTTEST